MVCLVVMVMIMTGDVRVCVSASDDDDLRGKEGWMRRKGEKCYVMRASIRGEREETGKEYKIC